MYKNNEGDVVVINVNYVIDVGLDLVKDLIVVESKENNFYVNIIMVYKGDENKDMVKVLVKVFYFKEI